VAATLVPPRTHGLILHSVMGRASVTKYSVSPKQELGISFCC
jgi:hypothetical protein